KSSADRLDHARAWRTAVRTIACMFFGASRPDLSGHRQFSLDERVRAGVLDGMCVHRDSDSQWAKRNALAAVWIAGRPWLDEQTLDVVLRLWARSGIAAHTRAPLAAGQVVLA